VIVGGVLSIAVIPPAKGKVVPIAGVKPAALARFKPIVPLPVPVLTVTV
jgi:hypothetical protein